MTRLIINGGYAYFYLINHRLLEIFNHVLEYRDVKRNFSSAYQILDYVAMIDDTKFMLK